MDDTLLPLETAWMQRRLAAWFNAAARELPWRGTRDLYRIWVSEIMLQQTTVATVKEHFRRFTALFPDVAALAAAEENAVLRAWEGLGYYRRARNMHAAAKAITAEHGGEFPEDPRAVAALPGIGRYTLGAILSIGRDARLPILEANTVRVWTRLLAIRESPTRSDIQKRLWRAAEEFLPQRGAGAFNQSLMELGALVCKPREPDCQACPLAQRCPTHAGNLWETIPAPTKKIAFTAVSEAAIVIRFNNEILLRRRGDNERWAGMWDFPRFEWNDSSTGRRQLLAQTKRLTGQPCDELRELGRIKHTVTRYRIELTGFLADSRKLAPFPRSEELRWFKRDDLADAALHVTGRKLLALALAQEGSNHGKRQS